MQSFHKCWPVLLVAAALASCGSATPAAPEGRAAAGSASLRLPTATGPAETAPSLGSAQPRATATTPARPASPTNLSLAPSTATPSQASRPATLTANDQSSDARLIATRAPIRALPPGSPAPAPSVIPGPDSQQTIELAVGETFQLKAVNRSNWVVKVGNQRIITPVASASATSPIEFKALSPGTTAIVATRPGCGSRTPSCRQPAISLHLIVIVHPPKTS